MSKLWIEKGAYGPAVRRWQELLLAAGYDLPIWGADGGFGDETEAATIKAQTDLKDAGLYDGSIDCKVGQKTLDAMHAKLDGNAPAEPHKYMTVVNGVEVHDYRGHAPQPKNAKPEWGDRWPKLTGVVLHRTACRLGEKPQRYFPVNAHIGVTLEGRIVLSHPFNLHIWHGDKPSLWTIGIEFDGNPEGYPGYYWKKGGGPDSITDAQVKAADVLLDILIKAFADNGALFKYIYAHRQSSDQRECDPGWQCWQKIAIPWMERTGAVPGDVGLQGTTFGTGYHISKHWDDRSPVAGFRVN